jgi:hypothetical protein
VFFLGIGGLPRVKPTAVCQRCKFCHKNVALLGIQEGRCDFDFPSEGGTRKGTPKEH